jgi:hypothetical protein
MPFEMAGRARLRGETTAGSYSSTNFTQFENGMMLKVAAVRHVFPDGSKFEGVGIAPDMEIHPALQDLKAGKDMVLDRALIVARRNCLIRPTTLPEGAGKRGRSGVQRCRFGNPFAKTLNKPQIDEERR